MPYDLIEFPFSTGLDQGIDPRRTSKFLTVSNYVWTKKGRLEKRNGYTTVPTIIAGSTQGSVITAVTVTAGGSGYTGPFFVFATGGGGGDFLGIATVTTGAVTAVSVLRGGYGFSTSPTFDFSQGGGTGAAATAVLSTPATPTHLAGSVSIRQSPQGIIQVSDGLTLYSSTAEGWQPLGSIQNLAVTTSPFPVQMQPADNLPANSSSLPMDPFLVQCNGLYVWTFGTAGFSAAFPGGYTVQDPTTDAILPTNEGIVLGSGATHLSAVNPSQVVTDGSRYVWKLTAEQGSGGIMRWNGLDCGSAALPHVIATGSYDFPDPTNPGTAISAQLFDCAWDPHNNRLFVAYFVFGDLRHLVLETFTYSPSLQKWTLGATSFVEDLGGGAVATCVGVSIGATGNLYYVAVGYTRGGNACVNAYDVVNGNLVSGPPNPIYQQSAANFVVTVRNISVVETHLPLGFQFHVVFTSADMGRDLSDIGAAGPVNTVHSILVTGTAQTTIKSYSTTLMTKPWLVDGAPYALCLANAGAAYIVLSLDATDGDPVPVLGFPDVGRRVATPLALINPRIATGSTDTLQLVRGGGTLPSAVITSATKFTVPTTFAPDFGASELLSLQTCELTFGSPLTPPVSEWTSLLYPASIPTIVGSATVRQAQFITPPVILSGTEVSTGINPGLDAGTYAYAMTYARVNDDGSITESTPSNHINITIAAANKGVRVYYTTYSFAGEGDFNAPLSQATYAILYRTETNGSALFRVATDPFAVNAAPADTSNPAAFFTDSASNASIASNPRLYTEGGVFDNVCPPACTIAARVRDRIYLAGTPDGFVAYYSDPVTNAGTTNFHDEQTITTDDDGPITAIAQLDANVVLFKANAIYVVFGTEGSNTGNGSTLSAPTGIPSGGIGCISQNSIIETPDGILFQSHRGIELISRSLAVTFIGEAVKDRTAGQTVVAAVLVPDQYQVRFYLSTWETLVLSTLNGEWTTFGYSGRPTSTMSDATNIDGTVYWCGNGFIMKETPGVYSDNGNVIVTTIQSGWITVAEQRSDAPRLMGYRRFQTLQLLGTYFDKSTITVGMTTDFSASGAQVATWTDAEILAIPGFDASRLQLDMMAANQRAEVVQVTILDTGPQDGTFNRGIAWDAFAFETRVQPGKYRNLPPAASR